MSSKNLDEGSVIWQVTMSLDGYIAAPGDEMSWVFDNIDPSNPAGADLPSKLGAVVAGRRSFEVGRRSGMEVYDGSWSGSQYLMTHRPVDELPDGLHLRSGPVQKVLKEALNAAGGLDVGVIGADIARQVLEADALDEILVHIAPVLLGGGTRFRGALGRRDLELVDSNRHGKIVTMHYRTPRSEAEINIAGSPGTFMRER